jgi:ketosteroid isomerase-like protein
VIRRLIDALNRGDVPACLACTRDDIVIDWTESIGLDHGIHRGHEAVTRLFHSLLPDAFEERRIEASGFFEVGDDIVVAEHTRMRGRDGIALDVHRRRSTSRSARN